MVLVSFKILIIGQVMAKKWCTCPYLGITEPFWANWAEISKGAQEIITNRLMLRSPSYDAYFSFLLFWSLMVWVELLGQPLSRNYVF